MERLKPQSLVVSTFEVLPSDPRVVTGPIVIAVGEVLEKIGVQIRNASEFTWHLPGLDRHYTVKAVITDARTNRRIQEFNTHVLHGYSTAKDEDVEKTFTSQSVAKKSYFSFYNISHKTFNNKCGKYLMHLTVRNPDGDVVYEKPKPIEIQLIPRQVTRVEVVNAPGLKVRLGEPIPSLQFKCFDNKNQMIEPPEKMTVMLSTDRFVVSQASLSGGSTSRRQASDNIELQHCHNDVNTVETGMCWQLTPKPKPKNSAIDIIPIQGLDHSFTVTVTDPSNGTPFEMPIKISVFPGVPNSIAPLKPIEIKLNDDKKSLQLIVKDAWNNPTAPVQELSDECWMVDLFDGPLTLDENTHIKVDGSGQITFLENLKASQDYDLEGTEVEQALTLKTVTSSKTILETSISLRVIPCHIPSKLQVQFKHIFCDNTKTS
jgi:hypothetical protein